MSDLEYDIQFIHCSSEITENERKRIIRKRRKKHIYDNLEPAAKKRTAEKKQKRYSKMNPTNKKALCFKLTKKYQSLDNTKKKELLCKLKQNYQCMNAVKKKELLRKAAQKYKTMDISLKNEMLNNLKVKYQLMEKETKNDLKKKKKGRMMDKGTSIQSCIKQFKKKITEGPYFICIVCNRLLYKKSVIRCITSKYPCQAFFKIQQSFDGKEYICKTCHSKVIKGKLPCQGIMNNMYVDETPSELASLEKLEQILIAKRIVFQKIVVMPKGQQKKIKGAICNVPVESDQTCNELPRPPERSGIIMLKLKRKLQFKGHVYFQAVRPELIQQALKWLKAHNPLYKNVVLDINNINSNLTALQNNTDYYDVDLQSTSKNVTTDNPSDGDVIQDDELNSEDEENDDPLDEYRAPVYETCLQSVIPNYPVITDHNKQSVGNEVYSIAPGENKHPVSFMLDKKCEELAFPVLFPKGTYGYTTERQVTISAVKYFNARLLHYSGKFATNPEYLFFAQFIIEQKKVSDSINIALKKVHGQSVTASQLRNNPQNLVNLICQNQAYLFLRQIPGTPPYWQKFMYEVIAMVKQLGIPTWFMTLSCADLRWPELFQILSRTQGNNLTDEQVETLSYNERCQMLNLNPVIVAKHFQHRVETFFREVLVTKTKPIGKIVYYALRIEFQMRGSPHLHALIWCDDCPKLSHDNKQAYIKYIDKHVQAYLPSMEEDLELHN